MQFSNSHAPASPRIICAEFGYTFPLNKNARERSAAGRFRHYVIRRCRLRAKLSAWAACDLVSLADDTRAHARRRSTRRFLSPDRFR
jgi:hypothetical protein